MMFSATVAWINEAGNAADNGVTFNLAISGAVTATKTSFPVKSKESGLDR